MVEEEETRRVTSNSGVGLLFVHFFFSYFKFSRTTKNHLRSFPNTLFFGFNYRFYSKPLIQSKVNKYGKT